MAAKFWIIGVLKRSAARAQQQAQNPRSARRQSVLARRENPLRAPKGCPAQRRGNTSPPATAKQRPSVGAFCGALLADGAAPADGDEALAQGAAPAYGAMPTECAAQADVATLAVAPAKVAAPANIASSADATAPSDSAASDAAGEAKR